MLTNTSEGKPFEIPQKNKEEMKKKYPDFDKEGLIINFVPKKVQVAEFTNSTSTPDKDTPTIKRTVYPPASAVKASGIFRREDGTEISIQYHQSQGQKAPNGRYEFGTESHISIKQGERISAGDWDKLFFLHYLWNKIDGTPNCKDAVYYFHNDKAEATNKINNVLKESGIERMMYDSNQTSAEKIEKACEINGITTGSIEEKRVALFERYKASSEKGQNAIMAVLSGGNKKEIETKKVPSDVLNHALNGEYLKIEGQNFYKRNLVGGKGTYAKAPYFETTYSDEVEIKLALVAQLEEDPQMFDELNKFIEKVDDKDAA